MSDPDRDAHGPVQLPDQQPPANGADPGYRDALPAGKASRWLVPAGVLAAVAGVLYVIALQLQVVLPVIGIVYVLALWIVLLLVTRSAPDARAQSRRGALVTGALAVGALLVFLGIYLVENLGLS